MSEREYNFVSVLGRARGMNTSGWAGAIDDAECTYSYNMSTTKDGEWKKRSGYFVLANIGTATAGETLALHWHTDEATDCADATTWLDSATEVDGTKSGALDVNAISTYGPFVLGGESVSEIFPTAVGSYVAMQSINVPATPDYTNFDVTAGRLVFYFFASPGSTASTFNFPAPAADQYLFYFSASFYLKIRGGLGSLYWKYGTGATEYLEISGTTFHFSTWYKIELAWDNSAGNTVFSTRFRFFVNDSLLVSADPAGAVTTSFDATVYWFNTGSAGTSAPNGTNWTLGGGLGGGDGIVVYIATISSYSDSAVAAAALPSDIMGIFPQNAGSRPLITTQGGIYYGASFTLATGSYTMGTARTSGTEWLGNFYIVDGTTNVIKWLDYDDTAISTITVPGGITENPKFIVAYHGHLWIGGLAVGGSGAYSVRCSDLDSASAWTLVNQVFKCKDTVRGMCPYAGMLVVGTKSGIEAISGYQPNDFAKTFITGAASCASHWSMIEVPIADTGTGLIWAGYEGVYMMMGQTVQKISQPIQEFWDTLSKTEIEECSAVDNRDKGEYWLSVSDGTVAENNWCLCYNYRKGDWSVWKFAHNMDVLGYYYSSGRRVLMGGNTNGTVYHLDRGDSDNGSAIDGYILTKWFDGGMPDQEKDYRKLYFWHDSPGEWYLDVGHSVDYAESTRDADIVTGTDGADYACVADHMPDIVVGTDESGTSYDYFCILAHTSAADNKPVTGGSYATYWQRKTGNTTGAGQTWATGTEYESNLEKKPITGSLYRSYWRANNTIGKGATWDAELGYQAYRPEFQFRETVFLGGGGDALDSFVLDTDTLAIAGETKKVAVDLKSARGCAIRFMFRNANAGQPFAVRGLKAWYTWVPEFPG